MCVSVVKSLSLVVALIGLLGCAAVEPQRKDGIESTPKVKEEDLMDNKSPGQFNQSSQGMGPPGASNTGQPMNTFSPATPESGGIKNPRRFMWKDRN